MGSILHRLDYYLLGPDWCGSTRPRLRLIAVSLKWISRFLSFDDLPPLTQKRLRNFLTSIRLVQGVPQNSLRFLFHNYSAHDAPRISILDVFKQPISLAVGNCPILKIEQYLTKLWRKYLQRHKIKKQQICIEFQNFRIFWLVFHNFNHFHCIQYSTFDNSWYNFINSNCFDHFSYIFSQTTGHL